MTNALTTPPTAIDAESRVPESDIGGVDGRTLRRSRNRDAVIASLVSLIQEGDLDPTVAKIADRAAVSHRSIFRYFEDLNDLARTAIDTAVRDALPLADIANIGEGSLEHRINAMVTSRMRVLQQTSRLLRVAHHKSASLPEIDRGLADIAALTRDRVRRQFAREIDLLETVEADQLTAVVSAVLGFEGYDHQSRLLDRTDEEIADSWRLMLHRVLG